MVELISGGSVINGATPSSLNNNLFSKKSSILNVLLPCIDVKSTPIPILLRGTTKNSISGNTLQLPDRVFLGSFRECHSEIAFDFFKGVRKYRGEKAM